jgi:two-component system sensor histidine kinase KdpD
MNGQEATALFEPNIGSLDQLGRSEAAQQSERLRTAIFDSRIHELRTPLTSIKASVTVLLTKPRLDAADGDELLTIIDED